MNVYFFKGQVLILSIIVINIKSKFTMQVLLFQNIAILLSLVLALLISHTKSHIAPGHLDWDKKVKRCGATMDKFLAFYCDSQSFDFSFDEFPFPSASYRYRSKLCFFFLFYICA